MQKNEMKKYNRDLIARTMKAELKKGMSINEKISAEDTDQLRSRLEARYGKKKKNKKQIQKEEQIVEKMPEKVAPKKVVVVQKKEEFSAENMTADKLQNRIMWSEILGEPVCKRRGNRRRRGSICR